MTSAGQPGSCRCIHAEETSQVHGVDAERLSARIPVVLKGGHEESSQGRSEDQCEAEVVEAALHRDQQRSRSGRQGARNETWRNRTSRLYE